MKVHKVGVVGLGTMGRGIVISLLTAGTWLLNVQSCAVPLKYTRRTRRTRWGHGGHGGDTAPKIHTALGTRRTRR